MILLEALLQLHVTQDLSLALNTYFTYRAVVCKTLKFVLLVMFVPLEGLCYLFSMLCFCSTSFGPVSLRYGSAAVVCPSNDSARLGGNLRLGEVSALEARCSKVPLKRASSSWSAR